MQSVFGNRILWLGVAIGLAGCGTADSGTTDGGTTVQPQFSSLYANYFSQCSMCHAPGAMGRTSDIEMTLDFSTKATAYQTLKGQTSGLTGNFAGCNGVPFIGTTAATSLVYAVLDQPTRTAFTSSTVSTCDSTAISDETVKVGSAPSADFKAALKTWLDSGAPNN